MKHALLLGAGFSSWAAGLPVAKDLFDFNIDGFGPAERRQLKVVEELKHDWDQENLGVYAEKFVAHALTLSAEKRNQVLWYIGRRLTDPFIWYSESVRTLRTRRYPLSIDEAEMLRHPAVAKARDFLDPFCKGWALSGIVTPNYDLVPEYALSSHRFNYGRPRERLVGRGRHHRERRPVLAEGPVRIAKVHGSLSWSPDGLRYAECRQGITGGALIVAPSPEKEIPKVLAPVWELAESILMDANRLLVFGYSFNEYDNDMLQLLERGGRNLESVLIVDIAPNLGKARELWPTASILACDPPPGGDDAIALWGNLEKPQLFLDRLAVTRQ